MTLHFSYSIDYPVGLPGMTADGNSREVESHPAGGTIHFGTAVALKGTKVFAPANAADISADYLGVAIRTNEAIAKRDVEGATFAATETVPVQTKGRVWVRVEAEVAAGDSAAVRTTAAAGKIPGAFAKAGTSEFTALAGVKFRSQSFVVKLGNEDPDAEEFIKIALIQL